MACCVLIAVYYRDPAATRNAFLVSSAAVMLIGIVLWALTRGHVELTRRDGIGVVVFGWLSVALLGALPFLLSGIISDPVSALFETMSGFTTTGASVLTGLEALPRSILFWRALTHLLGGMGVLVLCIAILPVLGSGGMQIYRAEMTGPSKDRLTPRIANTAKLLWGVYMLLIILEMLLLRFGGMDWFDATCHSIATIATGGFSTRSASIAAYNSTYIESVVILFMLLAGTNFALHYRALRGDISAYCKSSEFRFFVGLWLIACVVVIFGTWHITQLPFPHAVRQSIFQVTSLLTTTGFTTADYDHWPGMCRLILLMLMFSGACTGSTSGAIKNMRVMVVCKTIIREVRLFMQPQAVLRIKMDNEPIEENTIANIAAFVMAYLLVFGIAFLVMALLTENLLTASSAVIATLGGVGPGMAAAGPMETFADFSTAAKTVLILCMLLGRLELYTVLVILLPNFWKK
jgi:trk system potassium uptake protein TrkH